MRKSIQGEEWESLLKQDSLSENGNVYSYSPNNIQKWFEMEQKYKNMDEDESDEDDEEDEEEEITSKKKNRRKKDFHPIMGKKKKNKKRNY